MNGAASLNSTTPTVFTFLRFGAGGQTLGACYQSLAGYDSQQGFNDFIAALTTIDQGGTLALPPSGNPFPVKT